MWFWLVLLALDLSRTVGDNRTGSRLGQFGYTRTLLDIAVSIGRNKNKPVAKHIILLRIYSPDL